MIYLDNAATTKPSKAAVDAMIKAAECFGNPSSLHGLGIEAEKLINESKKNIADMLGVESKNILFTSGGTEANNLAVFGVAAARHKLLRAKSNIRLYLRHSENLKLTDLMLSILTLTVKAELTLICLETFLMMKRYL